MIVCEDRRLARALDLIARDLTRRPTLAEAARTAGFERIYFSKRFRKAMGIGFAAWSTRLRVDQAARLLSIPHLSISEVAAAVGYCDVTTFERNFRKQIGDSPRGYRRLIQEEAAARKKTTVAETKTTNAEIAPPTIS